MTTVFSPFRLILLPAAAVALAACSGAPTGPTGQPSGPEAGSLGPAGGTLRVLGGDFVLDMPARGLTDTVRFEARRVSNQPAHPKLVAGAVFHLDPEGLTFREAATLSLRFAASGIPEGTSAEALQLYRLTGDRWRLVRGSTVQAGSSTVTGDVYWTGAYAVVGTPVDRIELTGIADGGLYPGQSGRVDAALFDAENHRLVRTIAWKTSDPGLATVSNAGVVTAYGEGVVTITADTEGESASTTVELLPAPLVRWSGLGEWTTFQGNASHTGFLDGIVNPVQFAPFWTAEVELGTPLNTASFGPDAVFTSTDVRLGVQRAFGLSLQTGHELWSVDFGPIHRVHPPAYGNGTVYLTTSGHSDAYLYALDSSTGSRRFRSPYQSQWTQYDAPVVQGQRVYMSGGYYHGTYSFDATTGREVWFSKTTSGNQRPPAVRDGVSYSYVNDHAPRVIALRASDGTTLFSMSAPGASQGPTSLQTSPVLGGQNDLLLAHRGELISFDLSSRSIRWQVSDRFGGPVNVADGVLYVANRDGLEARREDTGALIWNWQPPVRAIAGPTISSPMIATKNLIFVPTRSTTYAVDASAGRHVWSYPIGGKLSLSPSGVLVIASRDGRLTAISLR